MKTRTLLLNGLSVVMGLYVGFGAVSSTNGQIRQGGMKVDDVPEDLVPKVKGFERTDLFSQFPPLLPSMLPPALRPHRQDSLVLFKMRLGNSTSKADYIDAAKQYLEREGFTITEP